MPHGNARGRDGGHIHATFLDNPPLPLGHVLKVIPVGLQHPHGPQVGRSLTEGTEDHDAQKGNGYAVLAVGHRAAQYLLQRPIRLRPGEGGEFIHVCHGATP
jgi:hypothetical protein